MPGKKLIHRFFEVFNQHDIKKLEDLLTPNAELYFPKTQPLIGKERILKFLSVLYRQYPELVFKIHRVIIEDDQAAVHWTNLGKNRCQEHYQNEGVTIIEFAGEKINFISDFFKDTEKF